MTSLFVDNDQYIYMDLDAGNEDIPAELVERYTAALLEWETVQDELAEIYKGR